MWVSGERDKIIRGEFRARDTGGDSRSEHTIQLTTQRRSIQEQNLEILDCVKVELEKASQLDRQRRNLPEQNLEILDYAKAQQEVIKKDVEVKKIIKDKLRAPQPEQVVQLTGERESLHNQVTETLDCIEEAMEKREVTQSLEALKTQRDLLMTAERMMQGAKRQTKELMNNNINGWEALLLDEHRKCVQFDRGRMT